MERSQAQKEEGNRKSKTPGRFLTVYFSSEVRGGKGGGERKGYVKAEK